MRFQLPASRVILVPVLGLALVAAATACSSSPSSTTTSPPSSAPASSSPAVTPSATATSSSTAVAQITANWEKFFNSSTPVAQKVDLVQNGSTFSSAITSFVQLPLASGIGAKVTAVVVNSSTTATVSYNITSGGTSLLSNQTGQAVYQDGTWKVGDTSLCGLFKLIPGGTVPSACKSLS